MNLSLEITLVREQHPIIGQSPKRENQTTLGGLTHVHMDTIVAEQQSHGRKIRETCRKSCDCLEKKVQVRISGYSARVCTCFVAPVAQRATFTILILGFCHGLHPIHHATNFHNQTFFVVFWDLGCPVVTTDSCIIVHLLVSNNQRNEIKVKMEKLT